MLREQQAASEMSKWTGSDADAHSEYVMPAPTNPRVRFLRSQIGAALRDGRQDVADEARRELAVLHAEKTLAAVANTLTPDERNRLASVVLAVN